MGAGKVSVFHTIRSGIIIYFLLAFFVCQLYRPFQSEQREGTETQCLGLKEKGERHKHSLPGQELWMHPDVKTTIPKKLLIMQKNWGHTAEVPSVGREAHEQLLFI